MDSFKTRVQSSLRAISKYVLKKNVGKTPFCVFSNDCWGGELYKWTDRPFNTPFIGLMLMAPCYLKFLQNPHYYLSLSLQFIDGSQYEEMNPFRMSHHLYPVGKLDDIEIHFLHYKSTDEAIEKWERRKKRIDWDHVVVKFSLDKDYAQPAHLDIFSGLPYQKKISFSKTTTKSSAINLAMNDYDWDGARMFRLSLARFDLGKFLKSGKIEPNLGFNYLLGLVQKKYLK